MEDGCADDAEIEDPAQKEAIKGVSQSMNENQGGIAGYGAAGKRY